MRAQWATKVAREVLHVGESADDAIPVWRMFVGNDKLAQRLRARLRAPDARRRDPEELPPAVGHAGQTRFWTPAILLRHPAIVRQVSLLDAAVIGDVLPLRVDAVQLRT